MDLEETISVRLFWSEADCESVITTTPNEPEVNTKQTKQADSVETPVVM